MTDISGSETPVRVRFCPSPTGNPHVGMVRTALFNWAYARRTGGTFVFRIEDTDSSRDTEQSYQDLLEALSWLGLDWDEGPLVGGPYAPYRQSQRMELYRDVAESLLAAGFAYPCFCTTEELEARRAAARAAGRPPGYDGHCRDIDDAAVTALRAQGRPSVVRFRMPPGPIAWPDLVRGDLSFEVFREVDGAQEQLIPDFVIVRANGEPLYPLVNPVDDAAMGITHVLRGEDLLSSTPRQIALYRALVDIGVAVGPMPLFGHLPYVMGEGNRKLSKRDTESSLNWYREQGFLPEGLLNYLALLGWSIAEDRDIFSMAEMTQVFDIERVNANPARFDLKKALAINAEWIRRLDEPDLARRFGDYLAATGAVPADADAATGLVVRAVVPLIRERMQTMAEGADMVRFLVVDEEEFTVDPVDAGKFLAGSDAVLSAAHDALAALPQWSTPAIDEALRAALIEGLGLKPRVAFGPVRVAVTGRRISPPLFESMQILGRDRTLDRLRKAPRQ